MSLVEGENAHKCATCNILKSYDKFNKDSGSSTGYRCTCKKCRKEKYKIKKTHERLLNIEIQWVDGELLMESFNARFCLGCDNLKHFDKFHKHDTLPNLFKNINKKQIKDLCKNQLVRN